MAKLTKQQRRELENVLANLDRAISYIMNDSTAICLRKRQATTTLDFTRKPIPEGLKKATDHELGNYALTEVNKEIGSHLTGLYDARRTLSSFLDEIRF